MSRPSFARYRSLEEPVPPDGREEGFDPREARRRWLRPGDPDPEGAYVLYWMQMYRRVPSNLALDEAARRAERLDLPLVVYEGLARDYPGAGRRIHRFVLGCARETARRLEERGVRYVFHLDRPGHDRPAAAEMLRESAVTVVDDYPAFILPGLTRAALERTAASGVPVLAVDDAGVVPLAEIEDRQYAARTIRPRLHRLLPAYLHPAETLPLPPSGAGRRPDTPVEGLAPVLREADDSDLDELVRACGVDPDPPPSPRFPPGRSAGLDRLGAFLEEGLARYDDRSGEPGVDGTSGLSPYLHFGCLSAREAALAVLAAEAPDGAVDAFLEQLVVRRELAFNFCRYTDRSRHASLATLPDWARETLREHASDPRPRSYSRERLERGETDDELWNAAQRELVHTGTIHNYMRMLWGKKLLTWTECPSDALEIMIDFHDRWALDGRDPNTYANCLWCFGLHDRAFGEREVFGKVRPMTSGSTRRKKDVDGYLERVRRWEARAAGDDGDPPPRENGGEDGG